MIMRVSLCLSYDLLNNKVFQLVIYSPETIKGLQFLKATLNCMRNI